MVHVGGVYVDYTGASPTPWPGETISVSPEQLVSIAETGGCFIYSDADEAASIIANAQEIAGD